MKKQKKGVKLEWYHGTEYKCQICLDVFYGSLDLVDHLTNWHGVESSAYRSKYGRFATRTVYYKCKVCNCGIIHLQDTIKRYLRRNYFTRTV